MNNEVKKQYKPKPARPINYTTMTKDEFMIMIAELYNVKFDLK